MSDSFDPVDCSTPSSSAHAILLSCTAGRFFIVSVTREVTQTIKDSPPIWEAQFRSLGQEDPLEKGMANHSSSLTWRILQTDEPGRPQSMASQRAGHDWVANTFRFSWAACFVYSSVDMSIPISQFIPLHLPHLWCPYISSLRLCLYFSLQIGLFVPFF